MLNKCILFISRLTCLDISETLEICSIHNLHDCLSELLIRLIEKDLSLRRSSDTKYLESLERATISCITNLVEICKPTISIQKYVNERNIFFKLADLLQMNMQCTHKQMLDEVMELFEILTLAICKASLAEEFDTDMLW